MLIQAGVFEKWVIIQSSSKNQTWCNQLIVMNIIFISAYILASQGYDVWLGNFRGSSYSRRHTRLDPDEYVGNFWCFTLDELALIDLPTMIDFVTYRTGVKSINYVGHSLGSTAALMLLSTASEYNLKLKSVNLFAPAQQLDHSRSAVITPFYYSQRLMEYFKCTEFMRHWESSGPISDYLCGENSYFSRFCNYGTGSVVGNSVNQVNDVNEFERFHFFFKDFFNDFVYFLDPIPNNTFSLPWRFINRRIFAFYAIFPNARILPLWLRADGKFKEIQTTNAAMLWHWKSSNECLYLLFGKWCIHSIRWCSNSYR